MAAIQTAVSSINFRQQAILAPMMKGGNPYFRTLALLMGAKIQCGSMAFAAGVVKRAAHEIRAVNRISFFAYRKLALMRTRATAFPLPVKVQELDTQPMESVFLDVSNQVFVAQLAANDPHVASEAAKIVAYDCRADAIDLNASCPKFFTVDHDMGCALTKRKNLSLLASLVGAMRKAVNVPITVKIRAGASRDPSAPKIKEVVSLLENAGACAITVHARFMKDTYGVDADWRYIGEAVDAAKSIPIIGNGDIRDGESARRMMRETGCHSIAVGRAALQRPWIFSEFFSNKPFSPTRAQRWELMDFLLQMMADEIDFDKQHLCDLWRFHAGWFIGFHADEKKYRDAWDALLQGTERLPPKKFRDKIRTQLKAAVLSGPEILPPLEFKHTRRHDNHRTSG